MILISNRQHEVICKALEAYVNQPVEKGLKAQNIRRLAILTLRQIRHKEPVSKTPLPDQN